MQVLGQAGLGIRCGVFCGEVHHDREETAVLGGQAQCGQAGVSVFGGAVALLDEVAKGVAVCGAFPWCGVDEAGDGQSHRRSLQDGDVLRSEGGFGGGGGQHGHAAPAFALVFDRCGEPAFRAALARAVAGRGRSGALLPIGECFLQGGARGLADQRLVDQVLQDDRAAAHLGRRAHDVLRSGTAQRQLGERLVDALGAAHRLGLVAEDEGVDDLRDLKEVDVLGEGDQRQPAGAAGVDEDFGWAVVAPYEFDDQGRRPDAGEFVDVASDACRLLGKGHAGGQDELAALEEGGGVGQFGDVDPADRPVEVGFAGATWGCPEARTGRARTSAMVRARPGGLLSGAPVSGGRAVEVLSFTVSP